MVIVFFYSFFEVFFFFLKNFLFDKLTVLISHFKTHTPPFDESKKKKKEGFESGQERKKENRLGR